MLVALVPLFDENMAVRAYSVFTQKNNYLLNPLMLGTGQYDGAANIAGLELIQSMGIETLSEDKEVFIPISNINVFADIEGQCNVPHERIALLIDNTIPPIEMYVNRLRELKESGFKLAIRKLAVSEFESYREVLKLVDYVFLNNRKIAIDKAKIYFGKLFPNVKLCAGNIDNMEIYEKLRANGGYQFYEGVFYRVPITKGQNEVAPLKVNYIELLNTVNDDNFELTKAADIIGRDTALTISLLKMVNSMSLNSGISSIRHAAAMLGQRELKKWINTAVVNALYADKPNEITRLSLLRAKFAENLASAFDLAVKKEELFLMGLFSVLDVILEKPMEEALKMVTVSKEISDALLYNKGKLAPLYEFMVQYETANWPEVSRLMILQGLDEAKISAAYMDSLVWYRLLCLRL
ncbi:MAG: HDOD domain-containing protein [Lachnospiraceae bacterium]|nr:HDOD domain-containing protein [Lachnospiraceae bacterium]